MSEGQGGGRAGPGAWGSQTCNLASGAVLLTPTSRLPLPTPTGVVGQAGEVLVKFKCQWLLHRWQYFHFFLSSLELGSLSPVFALLTRVLMYVSDFQLALQEF